MILNKLPIGGKKDISGATVTASTLTYNKSAQTPTFTVKLNGKTLTQGTDYTVSATSKTDAGTYSATITGKGNYKGSIYANWTIDKASIDVTWKVYQLSDSTRNATKLSTWSSGTSNAKSAGGTGSSHPLYIGFIAQFPTKVSQFVLKTTVTNNTSNGTFTSGYNGSSSAATTQMDRYGLMYISSGTTFGVKCTVSFDSSTDGQAAAKNYKFTNGTSSVYYIKP